MTQRIAYFKNASPQDVDQSSAISSLQNQIVLKADLTALTPLATTVDVAVALMGKADASNVYSKSQVDQSLAGKAALSYVDSGLSMKASVADVAALSDDVALKSSIAYVDTALAGKASGASVTALVASADARIVAENGFIAALKETVYVSNAANTGEFDYGALNLA